MKYEIWRDEIFGPQIYTDQYLDATSVPCCEALDLIDRVLIDPEVHRRFSKESIGVGLHLIFSKTESNFPYGYLEGNVERRVLAIRNLKNLYSNFFERYCTAPVTWIGTASVDGHVGFLCYMFWEIFVICPCNSPTEVVDAALDVMRCAIRSRNDNCIASAIHGIGHLEYDVPQASQIIHDWLQEPTTQNEIVLRYARAGGGQ